MNEPQSEGYPGYSSSSLASSFSISIHFRNQRFRTRPFACAGEPYINQGFLLELHKDKQQGKSTKNNNNNNFDLIYLQENSVLWPVVKDDYRSVIVFVSF